MDDRCALALMLTLSGVGITTVAEERGTRSGQVDDYLRKFLT